MDFTVKKYTELLKTLIKQDYSFLTFKEFLEHPVSKCIVLRHDVDLLPENSLRFAEIEHELGLKSTFFFQMEPTIYKIDIVKRISELGHEIGYHYKDIETISSSNYWHWNNGLDYELILDLGYESFLKNLAKIREDVTVKTICMHGSPRCKLDNKIIWQKYDYRKLDLIGEPYYAINWNDVAYLTDSGRRWNGEKFIVRDKVNSKFKFDFYSTDDIIKNIDKLPDRIMITTHPQRWSDNFISWAKEIVSQNIKNIIKKKFYVEKPYVDLEKLAKRKKKKYLFMLGHPAHFHLLKNTIQNLQNKGHETFILIKKKDVLENLLSGSGFKYKNILSKERKKSIPSFIYNSMIRGSKILYYSLKNRPDMLIGTSVEITHVGKLLKIPSIVLNEDDSSVVPLFTYLSYPFADEILTPKSTDNGRWDKKSVKYQGFQKLAYLTPKYFQPKRENIEHLFKNSERYFILRFAELSAHHDYGKKGITTEVAREIIKKLEKKGSIYISSERELEPEFEKYKININPVDMHNALYFSDLYIGDSQSMATEASILGTPSIRFNDFAGELNVLETLEKKYKLTFAYKTNLVDQFLAKIDELLNYPNHKEEWRRRSEKFISDNIDVTEFYTWFFENYPLSKLMLEINHDYQLKFK